MIKCINLGKPVAVTHSKGQGRKGPVPGSDIEYEQKMWRIKKNKSTATDPDQRSKPDPSMEGFGRKGNLDDFSSMAEIASCSYEARKVRKSKGRKISCLKEHQFFYLMLDRNVFL